MRTRIIGLLFISLFLIPGTLTAQKKREEKKEDGYRFTDVVRLPVSAVKNQQRTGTCWSFATTSFIESELMRMGLTETDLSEMYFVKHAYLNKADLFVRYHGMANFGQGGQAHDVMNVVREYGFVPETVYPGKNYGSDTHNHGELSAVLRGFLDGLTGGRIRPLSPVWPEAFRKVVETYLGEEPSAFQVEGKTFTPKSYLESTGFDPDQYVEITSYTHHPFYEKINLEVPDNWSGDLYYNLPVEELMEVIDHALMNGYTVAWDGDVSEQGMSHKNGVAILPEKEWDEMSDEEREKIFKSPSPEKKVTQEMRQETFNNFLTTDDHLMHIVGISEDRAGNRYYITKNSWGTDSNEDGGFLRMSVPYVKLKTIAIMVHRDAVPENITKKWETGK